MEFNEIINRVNGSSNMKTPSKFIPSNSGGDMNDKLNRVNQYSSPNSPSNKSNLANKGRNGDTKIRNVDGQPAHVNAYEAYMIDNWGKAGEVKTKQMGSGTINPQTGLKEYGFFDGINKPFRWFEEKITKPIREEVVDPIKEGLQEYLWDPIAAIFPRGDTGWFSESDSPQVDEYKKALEAYNLSMDSFGNITNVEATQSKQQRQDRKMKLDAYYRDEFAKLDAIDSGNFAETGSVVQKQKLLEEKLLEDRVLSEDEFNRIENTSFDNWLATKQGELRGIIDKFGREAGDAETDWGILASDIEREDWDYGDIGRASYVLEGTDYEYTGG